MAVQNHVIHINDHKMVISVQIEHELQMPLNILKFSGLRKQPIPTSKDKVIYTGTDFMIVAKGSLLIRGPAPALVFGYQLISCGTILGTMAVPPYQ